MIKILNFITKGKFSYINSLLVKLFLLLFGVKVGRNFYIEGIPRLKIKGKAGNIIIGDNVKIFGDIDLRNRENGKIILENNVSIDNDCRFVAANNSVLRIGRNTSIGPFCIFNCGVNVTIGSDCLISGMVYIQSSQHGFKKGRLVREQGHSYGEIVIGNDVWVAANAAITKGVRLEDGCVVGAKSLVREGIYSSNSVLAGVPATKIKERE